MKNIILLTLLVVCCFGIGSKTIYADILPPYYASLKITDNVVNIVRPELFGDNIEWTNDGMGFWRDDIKGFDNRQITLARDVGVTHLRYPGGTLSDYFHWNWAVGNNRQPVVNPFDNGKAAYPFFGPDEFMRLCKELNIKAYITLNAGNGTPEEAASWVKYNKLHHYPVSAYEVGNEIYMANPKIPGIDVDKSAEQYIGFYNRCWELIRKETPGVRMGAIGLVDTGNISLCRDRRWTEQVLTKLGSKINFLAIHNGYATGNRLTGINILAQRISDDEFAGDMMGAPIFVRSNISATKALMEKCCPEKGRKVDIHITESGPLVLNYDKEHAVEDIMWNRTLAGALYQAGFFNVVLQEPRVTSVNHLPFSQDYFGALIGQHNEAGHRYVWKNVVYYVFQMYSHLKGGKALETKIITPHYNTKSAGLIPAQTDVPLLDACCISMPNHRMVIMIINRHIKRSAALSIEPNKRKYRILSVTTLASESYKDTNTIADPDKVKPVVRKNVTGILTKPYTIIVPKHSLTRIEIQ